jgi:hypothetical protein
MTSDLIYMATVCSSSFIQAPTCCNKEIFLKILYTPFTHIQFYFMDMLHKYISLN